MFLHRGLLSCHVRDDIEVVEFVMGRVSSESHL